MSEKDERIIKHIGLYRLSLRVVLTKLFFDGNEDACGNAIQRLLNEERIQFVKGLSGGFSYYRLTGKEAAAQVLQGRERELGDRALPDALSVLWFCCMGKKPRHRLERANIERLLGDQFAKTVHCIEKGSDGEKTRIYRVFTPAPDTKLSYVVGNQITKHLELAMTLPPAAGEQIGPAEMIQTRAYAVAVIVDNKSRREKLDELIDRKGLRKDARIIVEIAPTPMNLAQAIERIRKPSAAVAQEVKDELPRKRTSERSPNTDKRNPRKQRPTD